MEGIKMFKLSILTVFIIISYAAGSVIKFEAYPSVLKTNLTSSASMRCSLVDTQASSTHIGRRSVTGITNTTDDVLHISAIYVTNSNGDDVASVTPFDAPIAYVNVGNLQVKADISATSSEGYLELSWRDPSAMALGEYTCEVNTVGHHHHAFVFQSTLEVTEVAPTVGDVVAELKHLKQKHDDLEQKSQHQEGEITDLKGEITNLKDCASRSSGFMAVMSSGFSGITKTYSAGQTIVFDKVISNAGAGYDPTTGVFICSEAGTYSFSVTALSSGGQHVALNLKLNSDVITSTYAADEGHANTAAITALLHLQKNDQVQVVVTYNGPSVFFHRSSDFPQGNVFVGHMDQSDCAV